MLKTQLPADATAEAAQRATRAKRLDKRLDQIETAQQALVTELETPADPGDPAAQALRERIRARYRELHTERAMLETQRDQLDTATTEVNDPTLLDKLPILGDILTGAPAGLAEQLFEAFHVHAVYSKELHQVTIHITITETTPQAIAQLLADARITNATQAPPAPAGTGQAFSHSPHPRRRCAMASSPTVAATDGVGRTPRAYPRGRGGHRERTHGGGEDIANGQRAGYRDLRLLRSA